MDSEGIDLDQRSSKNKLYWIIGIAATAAIVTFIIISSSLNLFNVPSGGGS
ncbi:MAG: hypothetical protein ACW986_16795 [Promethearchaeota archaeon]|jgi:hypothetical protein